MVAGNSLGLYCSLCNKDSGVIKMSNKRTYTETVASLEVHISYISNHLGNIDKHLEKLNTKEDEQNVAIAKNSARIGLVIKIGAGIFTAALALLAITLGIINLS